MPDDPAYEKSLEELQAEMVFHILMLRMSSNLAKTAEETVPTIDLKTPR